jgi:hypothetical protein
MPAARERILTPGGSTATFMYLGNDPPSPPSPHSTQLLNDAAKQRAAEQTRILQLQNLATRTRHRYSQDNRVAARVEVGNLARRFNLVYAQTLDTLEGRLRFEPPRRHTACGSELDGNRKFHFSS